MTEPTNNLPGPSDRAHPALLGAYVVGALDAAEGAAVREHVASCERCSAEAADLQHVAAALRDAPADLVLDELDQSDLAEHGEVPADELLLARTVRAARAEAGSRTGTGGRMGTGTAAPGGAARRPGRLLAAAAAVAVLAVGGGAGLAVGRATAPTSPAVTASLPLAQAADPQTGIGLTARYVAAAGWTRISVTVQGAPVGAACRLVVVGRDGRREIAGSWVIPAPGAGRPVDVAVALPRGDLARLELVSVEGKTWVTADV